MEYRSMTEAEQTGALEALNKRKNTKVERIDNASLPAGAAMYYYCRMCRHLADKMHELHIDRPRQHCNPCQELRAAGWDEAAQRFIKFRMQTCVPCDGSGTIRSRRSSFGRQHWHQRGCTQCDGTGRIKIVEE